MKRHSTVAVIVSAAILAMALVTCQQPIELYDEVKDAVEAAEPGEAHSLTVSTTGGGTVAPSGATDVESGETTQISATANAGCTFHEWVTIQGNPVIANRDSATTEVTLNDGDAEV